MIVLILGEEPPVTKTNPSINLDFPQTRWSLVVSASEEAGNALEELCNIYWRPVYGFLRRSGYRKEDAEDLTQTYFARLLKNEKFIEAGKISGRLRFYILGGVKRHLADFHRRAGAQKRGGGKEDIPLATSELDFESAEHQYAAQPADDSTPDRLFDQSWALDLLTRAHGKVRAQYETSDKLREYEILKPAIASTGDIDSLKAASELGIAKDSVRVLASRLRKTFRAALKEEISDTVTSREEVDEELAHLVTVFS